MAWRHGQSIAWDSFPSGAALLLCTVLFAGHVGWSACGGTAVVDGQSGIGGDGSGGDPTTTTTSPSTGSAVICVTPDPINTPVGCSSGVSVGSGQPVKCDTAVCDGVNQWTSSCEGNGCSCSLNGTVRCSCVVEGGGELCTGSTPSCCPSPFPP